MRTVKGTDQLRAQKLWKISLATNDFRQNLSPRNGLDTQAQNIDQALLIKLPQSLMAATLTKIEKI